MTDINKKSIKSLTHIQQSFDNFVRIDWANHAYGIQHSHDNFAHIDWANHAYGIQHSLDNFARIDWANHNQTLLAAINQIDSMKLATTFNQLNHFSVREISEVLEEYEITNKQKYENGSGEVNSENTVNGNQHLSYEEIVEIIDSRLAIASNEKTGFKKFVQDLLHSYGQDIVKYLISLIILPFYYMVVSLIIDNHMLIINIIQESLSNGVYVIGYSHAKKVIKKEGLSRYENIHLIGLIRVDSHLRINPSKLSTPVHSEKVLLDTVISVLERKQNWAKVEANIDGTSITGWIEESKIIKLKEKNNLSNMKHASITKRCFVIHPIV